MNKNNTQEFDMDYIEREIKKDILEIEKKGGEIIKYLEIYKGKVYYRAVALALKFGYDMAKMDK